MSVYNTFDGPTIVGIVQLARSGSQPIEIHACSELELVEVWITTRNGDREMLRLTPAQAAAWGAYLTVAAQVAAP